MMVMTAKVDMKKILLILAGVVGMILALILLLGGGKDGKKMEAMGFEINADMMSMMGGFTALRLFTLMGGMMDVKFTKEQLLDLNDQLNKIKRPN